MPSAELYVIIDIPKIGTNTPANVPMRGVEPHGHRGPRGVLDRRRPDVRVRHQRSGRRPRRERELPGPDASATPIKSGQNTWQVVGVFETDGSVAETEIWVDSRVLQGAFRRGNTYQTVLARLDSSQSFDTFRDWLTTNPQVNVQVRRESRVLRAAVARAELV